MSANDRGPERRRDDFDRDVSRWAYMVAVHRGKLVAIACVLSGVTTWVATTAGYRYTGPAQEMTRMTAVIDSARKDIKQLQDDGHRRDSAFLAISNDLKFVVYNMCLQVRAGDQYAQAKCLSNQGER